MTTAFVDFNGVVPEKVPVLAGSFLIFFFFPSNRYLIILVRRSQAIPPGRCRVR